MIPSSITAALASLQADATAAVPLRLAPPLVKAGLVQEGAALLATIDAAISATVGALDAGDPVGFAGDLVVDLLALAEAATDQGALADIRGTVGRAVFNLNQAIGRPRIGAS